MGRQILKDLVVLREAGVITEEVADDIRRYYHGNADQSSNRVVLIFGVLGALLVGLGIILIVAHNWDELSRPFKLFYALLPLLIGQAACGWTLIKRGESRALREACAVFLFFAVGVSIAMVSQVYNLPGSVESFLLTWMLLAIPVIYAMRSAMVSLLVIGGITWYACEVSYFNYPAERAWWYWGILVSVIPFYVFLAKQKAGARAHFHSWFIALSLTISLGMFADHDGYWMFIAYMSLFSLFILLGETTMFASRKLASNGFVITGSLGTTVLLLMFTFEWFWKELAREKLVMGEAFVTSLVVAAMAALLLGRSVLTRGIRMTHPVGWIFLVFIVLFLAGKYQPQLAQWLTNLLVLGVAVATTWRGTSKDDFFVLNYGLMIMSALILCRFFDTNLSFIVRGILFMVVGFAFFAANYWMLKRRKLQNV